MKRFILTGASGLLGQAWLRWLASQEEVEIISVGRTAPRGKLEHNTTHRLLPGVEELASWRPYAILHLAGPSRWELAEEDPEKTMQESLALTSHLVAAARIARAKLVLLSCDRVFDGGHGPFSEADQPIPASALGKALRAIEEAVEAGLDDRLVVRTSALFGWAPQRKEALLTRWTRRWDAGQTVLAGGEIRVTPTWVDALPRVVHALLKRDGLYHVAGPQRMSLYDLAREAARVWDIAPERVKASDRTPDGDSFDGGLLAERYLSLASVMPAPEGCLPDVRRQAVH